MSELEKIRDKIVALECPANESHIAFALGFGECRAMVLAMIDEVKGHEPQDKLPAIIKRVRAMLSEPPANPSEAKGSE